jgi:hypothetical protein
MAASAAAADDENCAFRLEHVRGTSNNTASHMQLHCYFFDKEHFITQNIQALHLVSA